MKMGRGLLFFALVLFLPCCATVPILPKENPDPKELHRRVQDRGQQVQGLKGLARGKVSAPGKNYSGLEILWVRRPSSLRLESLGPLGTPQLYLTADDQEVRVYIPAENRYYHGPSQGRLLSAALPILLPLADVVSILLGDIPWPREEGKAVVRRDETGSRWVLELLYPSGNERQTLWVHPQRLLVLEAQVDRPGLSYQLLFRDFQVSQGLWFPQQIQWIIPEEKIHLTVIFEEVELNPNWEAEDFTLPVPRGATVVPWE